MRNRVVQAPVRDDARSSKRSHGSGTPSGPAYSLSELVRYFLKLGTTGFGGPVALVGYMQRDLVDKRGWISPEDYKEGLTLAQLAPGPLAAQLAIYLGYVHYGILGATLVGLAFCLPSFLIVVALGYAYSAIGEMPWIQAVFYGIGASVIGIIAVHAFRLTARFIGKEWILWVIYAISASFTVITQSEKVVLFLGAGIVYCIAKTKPRIFGKKKSPLFALSPAPLLFLARFFTVKNPVNLWNIFLFFLKAGAFIFGSGLAIVPFLYGGVVKEFKWLNERQFLDAVAVAMITPGPIVITVGFIGYLVEGFIGATVAALATFLPCYLLTIIPAPYFKKYGKVPAIAAFVDGITAAAIGAITGAVVILGRRTLVDATTVAIAVVTIAILFVFKKIKEPYLIVAAALIGWTIKTF